MVATFTSGYAFVVALTCRWQNKEQAPRRPISDCFSRTMETSRLQSRPCGDASAYIAGESYDNDSSDDPDPLGVIWRCFPFSLCICHARCILFMMLNCCWPYARLPLVIFIVVFCYRSSNIHIGLLQDHYLKGTLVSFSSTCYVLSGF